MKRCLVATAGLAVLALPLSGCSTAAPTAVTVARPLSATIVPAALPDQKLTLQLDTTQDVQQAVRSVGRQILTSDVKFWQIHEGQRLVGALQLATLKSRVDPARAADRNNILSQILVGASEQVHLHGLPVWTTPTSDASPRAVYVWFGEHDFGVLQLQSHDIDAAKVAESLITHVVTQPTWRALPPQAYGES
jgi:hypothetical protein